MRSTGFCCLILAWFSLTGISCKDDSANPIPPSGEFQQLSPQSGETEVALTPTFRWEEASGATSYTLVVSKSSDFSEGNAEEKNISSTQGVLSKALDPGFLYYWKVFAVNPGGETIAQNSGTSFRTRANPPEPSPGISTYYVSPQGVDNPDRGSLEQPFKTLSYAVTRVPAQEGDTVFLQAGVFQEIHPAIVPPGVSVVGAGEDKTFISSTGVTLPPNINPSDPNYKYWYDGSLIQLTSPNRSTFRNLNSAALAPTDGNQTIGGFTIDGNEKQLKAGVWVENRNNVRLHHITFKNIAQRGAVVAAGNKDFYIYPSFYLTGILIHDCTFINAGRDLADETLGNLCIAQLDGAEIYNINVSDDQGYGIKFIYDGYFINTRIHHCNISLNESDQKWGEDISIELWNVGPGNQIHDIVCNTWLSIVNHPEKFGSPEGMENMKIFNVKMTDSDGVSSKEAIELGAPGVEVYDSFFGDKGFGMAVWDMGRQNISIHHNVFYNSALKNNWTGGAAIYIDNSREWNFTGINIFNNVFDTHNYGVRLKRSNSAIEGVNIKNNAFLNTAVSEVALDGTSISNISVANNLKFTPSSSAWIFAPGVSSANNVEGNPGFTNSGSRDNMFYKPLAPNSFVVDKGVNVGLLFEGAAPDIGAFEYEP